MVTIDQSEVAVKLWATLGATARLFNAAVCWDIFAIVAVSESGLQSVLQCPVQYWLQYSGPVLDQPPVQCLRSQSNIKHVEQFREGERELGQPLQTDY